MQIRLLSCIEKSSNILLNEKLVLSAIDSERQAREDIKNQQDREYQESLARDAEKVRDCENKKKKKLKVNDRIRKLKKKKKICIHILIVLTVFCFFFFLYISGKATFEIGTRTNRVRKRREC